MKLLKYLKTILSIAICVAVVLTFPANVEAQSSTTDLAKLTEDYLAAWNSYQVNKIQSFWSPNLQYYDPIAHNFMDFDRATESADVFIRTSPGYQWVLKSKPIAGKNKVAFEAEFIGKLTQDAQGNKFQQPRKYTNYDITILEFDRDGKILREVDVWDTYPFRKVLDGGAFEY